MKQTIRLNEHELNTLVRKSVKRVLNEGFDNDNKVIRELYDIICRWQDTAKGGDKVMTVWNYMDKQVRPYLDKIMYSKNID